MIKTKSVQLPEELELNCPKCGGLSRREAFDVFECGTCGFLFEAVIELRWYYGVKAPRRK